MTRLVVALSVATGCSDAIPSLVPAELTPLFSAPPSPVAGTVIPSPPGVRVVTADGTPVPGVGVTFSVSGGGTIDGESGTTDEDGTATLVRWTLGPVVGTNNVTASAANLTAVQFAVASIAGPPAALSLATPPSSSAQNRAAFPTQPVLRLVDANGNASTESGVSVIAAIAAGGRTLGGTTTVSTDANGRATYTDLSIAGTVGDRSLSFSATGLTGASAQVSTTPGPPSLIAVVAGDNQTVGELLAVPIAPAVEITDLDGNGVASIGVAFAVTGGGGTVTAPGPTTGANGVASVTTWSLGLPGANTLSATSAAVAGSTVTFSATATVRPVTAITVTAASGTPLLPGGTVQLAAALLDDAGRTLSTRPVTWSSSNETLVRTSASGLATGVLPGTASISAATDGTSGSTSITVNAPVITVENNGLNGYLFSVINSNGPMPGYQHGFSFYSLVGPLNTSVAAGTQLGWGGWILPANQGFGQALCPPGTNARENLPERGPTWWDVFQTIEGGVGYWISTRMPSARGKWRINSTPDCYTTQVASTGWNFGGGLLPETKIGLAVLSNRLLIPPDGFPFTSATDPTVFGNAWIALPLTPAYTSPAGVSTGDQSWTLFLHAENFRGPVAFYTTELWSAITAQNPPGAGRSHDAFPGHSGGAAVEIGQTRMFTATDSQGVRYRRVPRLAFPNGGAGPAVVLQDVRYYSKQAMWDAVATWISNGTVATQFNGAGVASPALSGSNMGVTVGGTPIAFGGNFTAGVVQNGAGQQAFGMTWSGALEPGVLPEYYREDGNTWVPVPVAQVPRETWLIDQVFPVHARGVFPALNQAVGGPWDPARRASTVFTTTLSDGSIIDYVWYRFVDQPAITRLGLDATSLQRLQTFAESLHDNSGVAGISMAAPSAGTLATIDPAVIVTPPAGLERGYVPVVIRQR